MLRGDATVAGSTAGRDIIVVASGAQLWIQRDTTDVQLPLRAALIASAHRESSVMSVHPRYGRVPFVDQGDSRARIADWISSAEPFSVFLLAGRGGSGKTRLAVEECIRVTELSWLAGFLDELATPAEIQSIANVDLPRLVVVDYAEVRLEQVTTLLLRLEKSAQPARPTRVLLLMRNPARSSTAGIERWLEYFAGYGPELVSLASQFTVEDLDLVPPVAKDELYRHAYRAFAETSAGPPPDIPSEELRRTTPLVVVLTAYRAATSPKSADERDQNSALDYIISRERRYWQKACDEARLAISVSIMARIVATMTLLAPDSRQEAETAVHALPEFSDVTSERLREVVDWASRLYPGTHFCNPLEPDLIGERLVERELASSEDVKTLATIATDSRRALSVLGRMDLAGYPAAQQALARQLRTASTVELLPLAATLDDGPHPDRLAGALVEALAARGRDDHWAEYLIEKIARLDQAEPQIRLDAVTLLLSYLPDYGFPWRSQDIREHRGQLRDEAVLQILLDIYGRAPEQLLPSLYSWLLDGDMINGTSEISRRDVALATLAVLSTSRPSVLTEVALTDDHHAQQLIDRTAAINPAGLGRLSAQWAASGDEPLMRAALVAVVRLSPSPLAAAVLRTLLAAEWSGRRDALSLAARTLPYDRAVLDEIVKDAEVGNRSVGELRPYLDTDTNVVLPLVEAAAATESGAEAAISVITYWYPADDSVDERCARLVRRTLGRPELASVRGQFLEQALYAAHEGTLVSRPRLELAVEVMQYPNAPERGFMIYALSRPVGVALYDEYRGKCIDAWLTSKPPKSELRGRMAQFVKPHLLDDPESLRFSRRTIQELLRLIPPGERLLAVIGLLAFEVGPHAQTLIDADYFPDFDLGVYDDFVTELRRTGDVHAALDHFEDRLLQATTKKTPPAAAVDGD